MYYVYIIKNSNGAEFHEIIARKEDDAWKQAGEFRGKKGRLYKEVYLPKKVAVVPKSETPAV